MSKPHSFQYPRTEIGLDACIHVHQSPMHLYISFTKPLNWFSMKRKWESEREEREVANENMHQLREWWKGRREMEWKYEQKKRHWSHTFEAQHSPKKRVNERMCKAMKQTWRKESAKQHRASCLWQNHLRNEGFVSQDHIGGFSMKRECANTHKHTIPNMKFNLKLLQIKCHVLGFTTYKAQNVLQRIIRVFAKAFVSHDRYTLFALEESGPPRTTYTCESQYGTQPSSVWISHWQPSLASPEDGGGSSPAHR
jgi:hypothetical protein